ncbi:hypothetical protein ACFE04_011944 [Oxalis oulophora]
MEDRQNHHSPATATATATAALSNNNNEDGGGDVYYPKPIVILDVIWNLSFVVVALVVLLTSVTEKPSTPLRVWLLVYALQCVLHVLLVYLDYLRKRNNKKLMTLLPLTNDDDHHHRVSPSKSHSRIAKRLESVNTMMSSVWWVVGFYWIVIGGQPLLQDSPQLYWLTVVFLAFDIFFIIFCIGMACIIFFFLFFCIPLAAVAYAVSTRQGASEEDIKILPRFKYRQISPSTTLDDSEEHDLETSGGFVNVTDNGSASELALHSDDSECCICLTQYVNGEELCTLPCNHHFHDGCIDKWLRINATCPLCKFNICSRDTLV